MPDRQAANHFLSSFLLPLMQGGPVHVTGILGPGVLESFRNVATLDGTAVGKLTDAMHEQLARVGPAGVIPVPCSDALALAAVWHNLFALTHPEVSVSVSLRRRVREWSTAMLGWVGRPRTADEVAQRHALLSRLAQVGRVDTEVTFWAGSARYVGVAPPTRLLAWEGIRRVRQSKTRLELFDLLAELGAGRTGGLDSMLDLVHQALALSPLTDLALLERPALPFVWTTPGVDMLTDTSLRGAAVRLILARPGAAGTAEVAAARVRLLERATLDAVARSAPQQVLLQLVRLHLEVLLTESIARAAPSQGYALTWDLFARLGVERTSKLVGLGHEMVERALGLDRQAREPGKEGLSLGLLTAAGLAAEAAS